MNKKKINSKVPVKALCFGYGESLVTTEFFGEGEQRKPKLNMVIYSGGIIKNHYYWDDLIIDLSGGQFNKKKYPILEDHWRDLKIAYIDGPPIVDTNLRVDPEKAYFVSTPESEQFQKLSSEGFPYEASVRVRPGVIERIKEGSFSEANGIKLKGPGTIFREWEFIEGSVCVFGYDRNTNSRTFSEKEEVELDCQFIGDGPFRSYHFIKNSNTEDNVTMDYETFKKEHPELFKQVQDEAVLEMKEKTEIQSEQSDEKFSTLSSQVEKLQSLVEGQVQTIKDLESKNLALEKDNAVRTETELTNKALRIWTEKLSTSDVPEHMFKKIQKHVVHGSFVDAETGNCDWEKFKEAVDAEIKDWETSLSKSKSSVMGSGFNSKVEEDEPEKAAFDKEDDEWVDMVFGLVSEDEEGGE